MPIIYKGACLKSRYYIDIVVEGAVVVELKAVAASRVGLPDFADKSFTTSSVL